MVQGSYHGWRVVLVAFLLAFFAWALGFYGPGIYLAALRDLHGWSIASISSAITLYYLAGGVAILSLGSLMERFGQRRVVAAGTLIMAAGVSSLGLAAEPWHVYAGFLVMSLGWACMSGAAVNAIIAVWFDRRRGLAVSLALNGASFGGVAGAPLLIMLIEAAGFATAVLVVSTAAVLTLVPAVALVLRPPQPRELEIERREVAASERAAMEIPWQGGKVFASARFQTVAVPFALGLFAQVGFLTHQVAFLSPRIGVAAAGWAVSLTTTAAIAGRLGTGLFVDRIDPRTAACGNFLVQSAGLILLLAVDARWALYTGCLLVGLGVGNLISLPPLVVQREFPAAHFARVVGMMVGFNQFAFAFGPGGLGILRDWSGSYDAVLMVCLGLEILAAAIVLRRPKPGVDTDRGVHEECARSRLNG